MKKSKQIFPILLMLIVLLCSCSKSQAAQWQEQYDLGVRYLSEGNYEEAIIAFTAAIEIDPNRAEAYVRRGDAYIGYGETTENLAVALADYEEAIAIDETNAAPHGWAWPMCTFGRESMVRPWRFYERPWTRPETTRVSQTSWPRWRVVVLLILLGRYGAWSIEMRTEPSFGGTTMAIIMPGRG